MTPVARPSIASAAIDAQVTEAVTSALKAVRTLGDDFIVNDSLWFAVNDCGKVTLCVMNSATFISKKFLDHLVKLGWTKEKELIEQRIDAHVELKDAGITLVLLSVGDDRYLDLFSLGVGCPSVTVMTLQTSQGVVNP